MWPLFSIIAMAASAGGLNALGKVLGVLPADLPVPIVVVQHLDPRIRTGTVDFVLPLDEIAPALVTLVMKGDVE